MHKPTMRILLSLAIAATLAACGEEPAADAPGDKPAETATPAPATSAAAAPAQPAAPPPASLPPATTAFERSLRALTNGSNVRFESEATLLDGSSQYASGVGSIANSSFTLRTLPQVSADYDGAWMFQGGRFLKQSGAGYDVSMLSPPAVARMFEAIRAIPQNEASLSGEAPRTELIGSVECNVRKIDIGRKVELVMAYKSIELCIDDTRANLLRLNAELQSGERIAATFEGHGEIVQLPGTQAKDWSQEYPRR